MNEIRYSIGVDDEGRAFIQLPDDYENAPEDRFFAMELVRYMLHAIFENDIEKFDEETINEVQRAFSLLTQLGEEMSNIIFESMKGLGDVDLMMIKPYHFTVKNTEELNTIGNKYISYNGRIYEKKDGLKVLIEENNEILTLNNNTWL